MSLQKKKMGTMSNTIKGAFLINVKIKKELQIYVMALQVILLKTMGHTEMLKCLDFLSAS